jgi:hypothetical protein
MAEFDWNDVRAFLAVARSGRLTAAAARLGVDHSTLSRRIAALEHALRTKLFDRSPSGYGLTEQGRRLMPIGEDMERLAIGAGEAVGGSSTSVAGTVRIGAPEGFGSYFLAPRIARLKILHPRLVVQLVAAPAVADEGQQRVGIDALGDPGAERGGAARRRSAGRACDGERLPAERGDEGRRDGHGQEEFGGVDGADRLARVAALDEQVGGDDRAPAAAAGGVEEAADQAQRLDDPRPRSVWRCMTPR